jgi:hypothetical protein
VNRQIFKVVSSIDLGFKELLLCKCEERSDEHLRNNASERSEGVKCQTQKKKKVNRTEQNRMRRK